MGEHYEKFEKYLEYCDLCEEGKKALKQAASSICADGATLAAALELKSKVSDPLFEMNCEEAFKGRSCQFGAFVYVLCLEDMERLYEQKNIPREVFIETAGDLGVWIQRHHTWFGEWGFSQYGWIVLHIRGKIFKLGRLQFEPGKITRLPPEELGLNLKEGDPFLNVHIPRGGRLDEAACLESFERAKEFFPKVLGYEFVAFGCFTWMFDPAFESLLPPDSNILKFQKMFCLFPGEEGYWGLDYVFVNITKDNIKDAPTDTYFQKRLVEHISSGGILAPGGGYRL
ncbi:MAG: acyltransferase domain-containing protein [Oscillospiraceae bacterium]|nr:acyltransferase domain-containing protein [Oscillospiraceae bacterium]